MTPRRRPALGALALALGLAVTVTAQSVSPGGSIADAQRAADSIEALRADPEIDRLLAGDASLKKKLEQAYAKLALANDALGRGGPYAASEAREFGIAAAREFRAVENALRTKWERARAAEAERLTGERQDEALRAAVRAEADALAVRGKELLRRPASSDPAVLERRGELGRALQSYARLAPDASLESLTATRDALAAASAAVSVSLRRVAPMVDAGGTTVGGEAVPPGGRDHPAPEKLRRAIAAFLAGDYWGTATMLAVPEMGDTQASTVAYLVRGAALFALYVESGERDASLLDRAVADVRACRQLDTTMAPSRALFSPRYAELFARESR